MKFRFRVERVENLGSHRLVYGTIGSEKVIANLSLRHPESRREWNTISPSAIRNCEVLRSKNRLSE